MITPDITRLIVLLFFYCHRAHFVRTIPWFNVNPCSFLACLVSLPSASKRAAPQSHTLSLHSRATGPSLTSFEQSRGLYLKASSAYKLAEKRINRYHLNINSKEIIQELQQSLCLIEFLRVLRNREQKRLHKLL